MNCQKVRQLLSMERDGYPAAGENEAVTAHVRDCPACRQYQEAMAAFGGKVRTVGEWEPAPRRDIRSRALDRWSAERNMPTARRQPWSFPAMPSLRSRATTLGTVAIILAAALSLAWWERGGRRAAPGSTIAHGLASPGLKPGSVRNETRLRGLKRAPAPPRERHPDNQVATRGLLPREPNVTPEREHPAPPHMGPWLPRTPSPQRATGAPAQPGHPAPPNLTDRGAPDEQYLDGRDPSLMAKWSAVGDKEQARIASILKQLPPPADDFARIPFPQIAAASDAGIAAATREYKQQAKVVDTRLYRKVTLQDKGVALSDFCAELQEQTGVKLSASRAVADEKVTVFVKEEPARDVMRAVSHLFGYFWMRFGRDGKYRYELDQDLKSQLAEEEMRRRDQDAALLAMDEQAQAFRPYRDLSWDQIPHREQAPLSGVVMNGGWGGMQLYHRLAPRDRAALFAGQELLFRPDDPNPERRLSPELAHGALMSWNPRVAVEDRPIGEVPGARVTLVELKLNRTELGQVSLIAHMLVAWPGKNGLGAMTACDPELATGRSPRAAKPDNATANADLRNRPPFDKVVSLHPEPTCPQVRAALKNHTARLPYGLASASIGDIQLPHVFSADVWEAVHRATGLPIVADYYTRMYRLDRMTVDHKPLFEALCTIGDALGVRWTKDRDFLTGRSTTYYWDKRKEVPNRYLLRWLQEKRDQPGLSIDSLLEMASLPVEETNSLIVGEAIQHCWGLEEWRMVTPNMFRGDAPTRDYLRLLAELTPEHCRRALAPGGLPLTELAPAEQQSFLRFWNVEAESVFGWTGGPPRPPDVEHGHLVAAYVPAGWYVWTPPELSRDNPWPRDLYRIVGRTAAEALAGARQIDPAASAEQVTLCKVGELHLTLPQPVSNGWKPARG